MAREPRGDVIYLRHRLAAMAPGPAARVGVLPLVDEMLRHDVCAELAGAFPGARVEVVAPGRGAYDVVVLPFRHGLHHHFLGEKTRALRSGLAAGAAAFVLYDVVHRKVDVVHRAALPRWYVRRLAEYVAVHTCRLVGWPRY